MKELDEKIARERAESRPLEVIALKRLEAGETVQWLNVLYGLSVNSNVGSSWQIEPDVTEFQNWQLCDDIAEPNNSSRYELCS